MSDLCVMRTAVEKVERGRELAIATVTKAQGSAPRREGAKMLVLDDGSIHGTIGGGILEKRVIDLCLEAIKNGKSYSINLPLHSEGLNMICGGEVDIFIDVHKNKPKLCIVGGGHVGTALYKFASLLDYSIRIFDDREEYLKEEDFPLADDLIIGDMRTELEKYPIDGDTYVVITTRGSAYDEEALEAVANSNAKYIGAIGSKKKVITVMESLKKKGFDEETLSKIYAPIGLKISGETPEEVALSIIAEIELVRNNGELVHMKYY